MLDSTDFVRAMKVAAVKAVEAEKPADVYFGQVISTSPLKIMVEQKMTLGVAQLSLSRNVTDFETEVTVNWLTDNRGGGGSGSEAFSSHNHPITGRKKIIIHNTLDVGDEVILLKKKGGQKYIVLDRVVNL